MADELAGDAELLERYRRSGDEAAFEELARRHSPMVYRACLRLVGDAHAAEDAAQAVFVILARRASSFRAGGELAAWLHGMARRVAAEARRGERRRVRREGEAAMVGIAGSGGGTSDAERAVVLETLDREVGRLPAAERQAVVLRYLEGRSLREAAEVARCPEGTLGRRAHDGLERLRARLGGRGAMLGSGGLAGLLAAEASAAVPESLLPSILAASKLAAAGAGAGAAGGTAVSLAEGVLKAMFWIKVKLVAAVVGAALVAGGGGAAVVIAAAEPPKAEQPKAESPRPVSSVSDKGIECRVTAVLAGGKVTLSSGSAQGVKEKSEFDVSRDGKKLGEVRAVAVAEKESTAEIVSTSGEIKVGDTARTRFGVVTAGPQPPAAAPATGTPRVFAKVVTGGEGAPEAGRSEDWIRAETAKVGSLAATDTTGWIELAEAKKRLYSSPMGGRLIEAREAGRTDAEIRLEVTGYKIGALRREPKMANKPGERLVIKLTDYPGAGNVFLALRVGEAPAAVIAWGEAVNGLRAGLVPLGGQPGVAVVIVSGLVKHINAGKPVARSLAEIAGDNPGRVAEVAKLMEKVIRDGKLLAEAMRAHPDIFDAATVEAVHKSEEDRTLDLALEKLSAKLAAAGQGGGPSAGDWPEPFVCPKCSAARNVPSTAVAMVKCPDCGRVANPYNRCASCAAARRVCRGCGAAKPSGATFPEGQAMVFDLHLRNVGDKTLKLSHPGNYFSGLIFTAAADGARYQARYSGPIPAIAWTPATLAKGQQVAFVIAAGYRKSDGIRNHWRFEDVSPGRRAATPEPAERLPAGRYTVTALYKEERNMGDEFWRGEVTTGAVEIEIKAGGAAATEGRRAQVSNGLKLTLKTAKGTYRVGEALRLTSTFENVGGDAFSLTFWWNRFLRVTDTDGKVIDPGPGPELPCGAGEELTILAPGKSLQREEAFGCTQPAGAPQKIGWSYSLKPGTYRISLVFEAPAAHGYGQNKAADAWKGRAISNEVAVTITK